MHAVLRGGPESEQISPWRRVLSTLALLSWCLALRFRHKRFPRSGRQPPILFPLLAKFCRTGPP